MGYNILKTFCLFFVKLLDSTSVLSLQSEKPVNTTVLLHGDMIDDAIQQFCPLYCDSTGYVKNECCMPCDCTVSCFAAGTCCIDKETENTYADLKSANDDLEEICGRTAVGDVRTKSSVVDIDAYMLIQSCPSRANQTIGREIVSKCLQPDLNILDEMVPIYSNITDRHYRNMFCAKCNEDSNNTILWESHFTCDFYLKAMMLFPKNAGSFDNMTLLQRVRGEEGCILQWKAANDQPSPRHCIDHNEIISGCYNQKYYSPELDRLCQQIYSPVKGFLGIYKNVFCLKCNEGKEVTDFKCTGRDLTIQLVQTFSAILGPDAYLARRESREKISSLNCKKGYTYDYNLKTCILKGCPISEVEVGDKCLPIMLNVEGLTLDYRFMFLYPLNNFKLPPADQILAEASPLVLHHSSSVICAQNVLGVETWGKLVKVRIQMTKVHDKKRFNLREDLKIVQEKVKEMNKQAAEGKFSYTVEMDNSPFAPIGSRYVSLGVYVDFTYSENCGSTIAVSDMQFCDTVLVNDFVLTKDDIVHVEGYYPFTPGEYVPTLKDADKHDIQEMIWESVYICYDLYVSRRTDSSLKKKSDLTNMASTIDHRKYFVMLYSLLYIVVAAIKISDSD